MPYVVAPDQFDYFQYTGDASALAQWLRDHGRQEDVFTPAEPDYYSGWVVYVTHYYADAPQGVRNGSYVLLNLTTGMLSVTNDVSNLVES